MNTPPSSPKTAMPDEERKRELEAEMERHKARFLAASQKGIEAFRKDLSIANWVGAYPVQAAMVAFVGGICLGALGKGPRQESFATKPLDPPEPSSLR
jgi:hypothetical protein